MDHLPRRNARFALVREFFAAVGPADKPRAGWFPALRDWAIGRGIDLGAHGSEVEWKNAIRTVRHRTTHVPAPTSEETPRADQPIGGGKRRRIIDPRGL